MDFRRKFEFGLAWRTILLIGAILLIAKAASTPGVRAGLIVAAIVGLVALASLWNFIRRTNFLVSRFIESVRFEDYSQRFSDPSGGGFDVLGQTLDQALKTLQARHTQESAESRYLGAIVDDAPSALLTIDGDGRVEVLNKAARQLFARMPMHRLEDLDLLGAELAAAVRLRRHFQCTELALHRQDRQNRDRLIEPRDLRRREDRLLRHAVEHQARDLARAGGQADRRRKFRAEQVEILEPVHRNAREQLPRRLVQDFHAAIAVDCQKRARDIVDDRAQIARLGAFLRVPRLQGLQRLVEGLSKHVESAAARV